MAGRSHAIRVAECPTGYLFHVLVECVRGYSEADRRAADAGPPTGFSLSEVVVRLARPDERARWDALMDRHHYLGFKRFAGRGLRYLEEWRGQWSALAGWQTGAFKCAPRWIGWRRQELFPRLHLIANNTRFLVLSENRVFPNLASYFMSAMLRRLSDDWQHAYGHPLLVVESFVDPTRFTGTMY